MNFFKSKFSLQGQARLQLILLFLLGVVTALSLQLWLNADTTNLLSIPGVISAGVASFAIIRFPKSISSGMKVITSNLQAVSEGRKPELSSIGLSKDVNECLQHLHTTVQRIESAATFASRIGNGEVNATYESQFADDVLAESLQSMQRQLKHTAEENEKRSWITTGLANFGETLRAHQANVSTLCAELIVRIVKYLKANQGQLYILNEENETPYLELKATYAWDRSRHVTTQQVKIGEGLVGQAWAEKEAIFLKEVPNNYIRITSGLGQALPSSILIVPLILNDKVFGILEVASFKDFQSHESEFLQKLGELIASTLSNTKINEQTKQLLAESQHQAEELRAQEEEMRQNMEELTATQEEMLRKDIELSGQLTAINNSMATIEFSMDGHVISANDRFCQFSGYTLHEIRGKHHKFFLDEAYAGSADYETFWQELRRGTPQSGEFKRVVKNGRKVWISASYTVVLNADGTPLKVIKFALDITEQKMKSLDFEGQIAAVNRTMASIEFDLNGNILSANEIFLKAMGFDSSEIIGRHHSMFIEKEMKESDDYKKFWDQLRSGMAHTGEFQRFGKNRKEVWIQASYTPIRDAEGNIYKVVKFAQDITHQKLKAVDFEGQISAVDNTMAMIEFNLDGTIVKANTNFLNALGYTLNEVVGKHHSMFVDVEQLESEAYIRFWNDLRKGLHQTGEFKRVGKNGKVIWISASYTPIKDLSGRVYKVIKFAQDISESKIKSFDYEGQIQAIRKSNAVVEFDLTGKILYANALFLQAMGYRNMDEIANKHHRIFVHDAEIKSDGYRDFWKKLAAGEYLTGEFNRKTANGASLWIYGSYNPILNPEGRVYKVVKYAQVLDRHGKSLKKEPAVGSN